ncbi:MAG TPA: YciI family protein [Terriglobia bacterium]|nr:YciI family protein [Terriglobia bacterium]
MKYILMMNIPKSGYNIFGAWSEKDIQANIAFVTSLNRELRESGEFVGAEGLALPDQAVVVRAGASGAPVTDGVFPESKEFLAGYLIVDVENPERAYEIAARWSASPGPGGAPLNAAIEVRPIMSGKPDELP